MGYYATGYFYDAGGNRVGKGDGKNGTPMCAILRNCYWVCHAGSAGVTILAPKGDGLRKLSPDEQELVDCYNDQLDADLYVDYDDYTYDVRDDERYQNAIKKLAGNPLVAVVSRLLQENDNLTNIQ
jgi:hypothetical protein